MCSRGASCFNVVSKVDIWYVNISKCYYLCAGARNRVTLKGTQTPKPVAVPASVLKDKTPNCAPAQPSTPKIRLRLPLRWNVARKSACMPQSPNPVPALELDSSSPAQSPNVSISRHLPNRTDRRYPVRQRKASVKPNL